MAARKKCSKCGAGNDGAALTCSLCGQKLPPMVKTTMEAFELEPRQWTGNSQRRRGDKDEAPAASPAADGSSPQPSPAAAEPVVSGSGHFLLPPVGSPLKLEPGTTSFVFGRDEACSVRIASAKVSRRHAELRWRGNPPTLVLRDLNSQNGTYLNDRKMTEEVMLSDGDTIRMGDYIASYRFVRDGEDISSFKVGGETAIMETLVVYPEANHDSGGGLTGDAAILPIHEVMRRLLSLHAGGILAVDVGGTKGQMKLVDGRAVDGFYAGLEGTHAVQAMSSLTKGRFRFDPDPDAPAARPPVPTARMERPASGEEHPAAPGSAPPRPAGAPGGPPRGPAPGPRPAAAPRPVGPPPAAHPHPAPGGPGPARPAPPPGPRPAPRPPAPPI